MEAWLDMISTWLWDTIFSLVKDGFVFDIDKLLPNNFNKRPNQEEPKYSCFFMKFLICNNDQKKHQVSSKDLKKRIN